MFLKRLSNISRSLKALSVPRHADSAEGDWGPSCTGRSASSEALVKAMEANKVGRVVVEARETEEGEPTVLEERRDSAMRSYVTGLRAFKEVLRFGSAGNRAKVRRARRAVHGLVSGRYEWIAFTSANAVRAVCEKFQQYGLDARVDLLELRDRDEPVHVGQPLVDNGNVDLVRFRELDGVGVVEEIRRVQHVHVQGVALDPLAAIKKPAKGADLRRDFDADRRLHRVHRAHLVGDRADPADPGRDVRHLRIVAPPQERLVEPRRFVNPQFRLTNLVAIETQHQRPLPFDPGQGFDLDDPLFSCACLAHNRHWLF